MTNTLTFRTKSFILGAAVLVLALSGLWIFTSSVVAEHETATKYVIQQGQGFPPYDVPSGGIAGGFSVDIIQAICDANSAMDCEFKVGAYSDCLTNVPGEPLGLRVGDELTLNQSIGCITWGIASPRISRGLAFTDPIVTGAVPPGTPNATIYGKGESANTSGTLYFVSGWVANGECAANAGFNYAGTATGNTPQDTADTAAVSDDDFLISDIVSFVLPAGYSVLEPIDCAAKGGAGVMMFPSANLTDAVSFHADFRQGLRTIAANGTYDEICLDASGGADPVLNSPFCFDSSTIPPPNQNENEQ